MWPDTKTGPALRAHLKNNLRLPLFVAPMFLISGPELIIASARAGALSAFPTVNARTPKDLDQWLADINEGAQGNPWGVNLIVHRSNARLENDLAATVRAQAPLVVASVGAPDAVTGPVHDYGGLVFSDVASLRHARKAVAASADGLVLLTAGAGGNTGWLNPFAFVAEVSQFFDGPIAVAGAIGSGRALHALEVLDADLGYAGTPFIAHSKASPSRGTKTWSRAPMRMASPCLIWSRVSPPTLPAKACWPKASSLRQAKRCTMAHLIWHRGKPCSAWAMAAARSMR